MQATTTKWQEDATYEKNIFVQRPDCIKRFKYITDVNYVVELGVPKGDWYIGKVQYEFKVIEKPVG